MAKERLSKLQKRILFKTYETLGRVEGWGNGHLRRYEIIDDYFGKTSPKAEASTSRAIRNLINKKLIAGFTIRRFRNNTNNIDDLKDMKFDYATVMAMTMKKQGKTISECAEEMKKDNKEFKASDKFILPAIFSKEVIKAITLTDLGKEAVRCLKLSNDKKAELNNKDLI